MNFRYVNPPTDRFSTARHLILLLFQIRMTFFWQVLPAQYGHHPFFRDHHAVH